MHCWQGDDVGGFECREDKTLTGGILATGSRPGKARNADELRQDAEKAFSKPAADLLTAMKSNRNISSAGLTGQNR